MDQLNPVAMNMWIFGTALGYAIGGGHGAAIGLAVTSGISYFMTLVRS